MLLPRTSAPPDPCTFQELALFIPLVYSPLFLMNFRKNQKLAKFPLLIEGALIQHEMGLNYF